MQIARPRLVLLFAALVQIAPAALGQMGMGGAGRSLGGYGAAGGRSSGGYSPLPTGGRVAILPASPRRISESPIGGASAPAFRGSPGSMMGARRPASGGMGMGLGGSAGMPMTRAGGMRRASAGPGLGWPFTVPPNYSGARPMGMP